MVDVSKKAKIKWHGKWIWANYVTSKRLGSTDRSPDFKPLGRDEMNVFVLFRRKFNLAQKPTKAIMNITADSRYKLFINGKYVGRGINRCEAYYWYYNQHDVTNLLQQGENVIAVHARFYGVELAYYTPPEQAGRDRLDAGKGGLLFELCLANDAVGTDFTDWIGSDEKTKVIRNVGERSDMPLKNDALGFTEEFDSRKLAKNWNEVDFNDSGWETPLILNYPIKTLLLDENHPRHEELLYATKIIRISEVNDIFFSGEYDEKDLAEMDFCIQNMLEDSLDNNNPVSTITVKNPESLLSKTGICEIIPKKGGSALSILLQFEKEMVGRPRIIVEGPAGTMIDIISSEKMQNKKIGLDLLGTKRGCRLILRGDKQVFEQWDWEGFLYSQIKIRKLTGPVKIYFFACNFTSMRTTRKGRFVSNDANLNNLWETCAHTLRCCAIDGYLDCPSREQRSYLGDAYPEALIATACFGEPRLTKRLIYDTAFGQRKDGITFSFHPGDYKEQCHIIPDYCFYWIQIAYDYWLYYGDDQALYDLYPHFVRAIEWFWKYIDPEMNLIGEELPYWKFIDWSYGHEKPGFNAIINTQFVDVLRIVSSIAIKCGDHRNADKFHVQAEAMAKIIEKTYWDAKEGCYQDYYKESKLSEKISQQTNAYLVIKGIAPKEKWASIIKRVFDGVHIKETISQIETLHGTNRSHHEFGKETNPGVLAVQPFFMHHVNRFFGIVGRFDLMMLYFLKGWVPMLSLGETGTIWETWSKQGSECHAWAATPAYDLSTYWLGVKPLEAGFKKVEISPTFYGLNQVEGMFPACCGDIQIKWKKLNNNSVDFQVELPATIPTGVFIAPKLDGKNPVKIETSATIVQNKKASYELKPGKNSFIIRY